MTCKSIDLILTFYASLDFRCSDGEDDDSYFEKSFF